MKQSLLIFLRRRCFHPALIVALAALLALAAGCVTQAQVKAIVAESNAAMLATEFPEVTPQPTSPSSASTPDWKTVSRKIDAFIQAHPDQPVAAGALRVRQAILLLANQQYDLARSAFEAAQELKTDRDKALKQLAPQLIWWYQHSCDSTWNSSQREKAREVLTAFDRQIQAVSASLDIRDFLSEMRAWIGLQLAAEEQGETKVAAFKDTLTQYARIFTTNDIAALKSGLLKPDSTAITLVERRRLRALAVLEKARTLAQSASLASLKPEDFPPAARPLSQLVLTRGG